jgi:hypothetical protein
MTTTLTIGSAHQAWNNKGEGTTMTPRRDSLSWERKFWDAKWTITMMITILSTQGGKISDQPHQRGETEIFENDTVKRESNYGGNEPFNINEKLTPSNKKQANNDEDNDDHLDDPFSWEHWRHTIPTAQMKVSFGGVYLNANQWQHKQGQNSRTSTTPMRTCKTSGSVAQKLGDIWNVAVTIRMQEVVKQATHWLVHPQDLPRLIRVSLGLGMS